MARPPLRTASETLIALYAAAGCALLLCWADLVDVLSRLEHGPVREQLLALLPADPSPPPVSSVRLARARAAGMAEKATAPPPVPEPAHPSWWRPISEEAPLRVWVVGDSLVNLAAPELKRQLEQTGLVTVKTESRPNTGLVREDYFSWPARFERYLSSRELDVIVMMAGANDSQNMMVSTGRIDLRTDAWLEEYTSRVTELMDLAEAAGVRMYWAGLPVMRQSRHHLTAQLVNPLLESEALARPGVHYVSTWSLFADDAGAYRYWGYDEQGRKVSMRESDGVHFTMSGAIRLADHLHQALAVDWPLADQDALAGAPDSGQP